MRNKRKIRILKKIVTMALAAGMLMSTTANAYDFPEPDWGALLAERQRMETETDFELYGEARPEAAPYYWGKFEPRSGTYIGMTADNDQVWSPFTPLGSYLTYIQSFDRSDLYVDAKEIVKSNNVITLVGWTINSMDSVDYDAVRTTLDNLNKYNKPMLIRFANEMNCSSLGDDPDKYVQVFRNVANMIHEYPNFGVVWSPNDMGALDRPFEYFYPGDEYVDWVGVSCYLTRYFTNEKNTSLVNTQYFMTGDYAWTTNKLKPFMEFLSKNNINKPVMISEGGVARYNGFGDDYSGWNEPRMRNMLWNTIMKYPQIKMINYFNVPKFGGDGEHYSINDYSESVNIFNEAAGNGAYLRKYDDTPSFSFSPANNGETFAARDGLIRLYTLAYFENQPYATVTYRIDGEWYHESSDIPYTCMIDPNSLSDGAHSLTITSGSTSKSYNFIKRGQAICFGGEPDSSLAAQQSISATLNGNKIDFDQEPVIIDGSTLVPLRAIFEAMNASVSWDDATKTVTASRGNDTIKMTIGSNTMFKNSKSVELEVSAQLINDFTMVPVRAVAEAFGADVQWDGDSRTVIITE